MNTVMTYETQTNDSAATEKFGEQLGRRLKGGEVIELISDLGGGKTTLVRGLANGAGSSDVVSSPTFMIQKQYTGSKFKIHHFDLYRLGDDKAMIEQTITEEVESGDVVVAEWADRVEGAMPKQRVLIELRRDAAHEDVRNIICHYPDDMEYLFEGLK